MENKIDIGKFIDQKINERLNAQNTFNHTSIELMKAGVKFGTLSEDKVPTFEITKNYLPNFLNHLEEYEWDVSYSNGDYLRQYDIAGESHYGNIDQKKLKKIHLVSTFEGENDNQDRRVIATLDWEQGKIDVLNGIMSIEDRNTLGTFSVLGEKKLILFKRVRFGHTIDSIAKEETGEVYMYKRYYCGFETKDKKIIVCLYPNGEVKIDEFIK